MAVVDRLLVDCGWSPKDLEGLAVSIGPGSFTGLRVGVATVKGLALALDLPVAPVPTLDALAATLPFAAAPVCPLLDARKGEVYCSLYRWQGSGDDARVGVSGALAGGRGRRACAAPSSCWAMAYRRAGPTSRGWATR